MNYEFSLTTNERVDRKHRALNLPSVLNQSLVCRELLNPCFHRHETKSLSIRVAWNEAEPKNTRAEWQHHSVQGGRTPPEGPLAAPRAMAAWPCHSPPSVVLLFFFPWPTPAAASLHLCSILLQATTPTPSGVSVVERKALGVHSDPSSTPCISQ